MVESSAPVDLSRTYIYLFGTPVAVNIPKRTWRGFDVKNEMGVYIGHPEGTARGGLIYFLSTGAILTRTDLVEVKVDPPDFARYVNSRNEDKSSETIHVTDQTTFEIDEPSQLETVKESKVVDSHNDPIHISKRKLKRISQDIGITTRSK